MSLSRALHHLIPFLSQLKRCHAVNLAPVAFYVRHQPRPLAALKRRQMTEQRYSEEGATRHRSTHLIHALSPTTHGEEFLFHIAANATADNFVN
jgi:uncharacterized protein (DUF2384 family)